MKTDSPPISPRAWHTLSSLISVLVTEIQPQRVGAVNDSMRFEEESSRANDLGALDPCDEHRDEGVP
ncbi:hypothetical protein B5K11_15210 [Rhizobium leguminosarum bv. trifolii]|nr:hypothetical protein B5K11_15210 [Rhizobium leguminosarum bv. trifolii]